MPRKDARSHVFRAPRLETPAEPFSFKTFTKASGRSRISRLLFSTTLTRRPRQLMKTTHSETPHVVAQLSQVPVDPAFSAGVEAMVNAPSFERQH